MPAAPEATVTRLTGVSRVGLVADTHDLLRPELCDALADVELILHAGDLCSADILGELERIAPVLAVRGNNDRGPWASALPEARTVELDGLTVHIIHALQDLDRLPAPDDADLLLVGHSHRPGRGEAAGLPWINPGSPGRRRFRLPVSCARMIVRDGRPDLTFLDLLEPAQP